jgi:ABC-type sugar transport system permease subunit
MSPGSDPIRGRPDVATVRGLRRARPQLWGYAFLLPMLALLIVFKVVPMGRAVYLSLTSYDLLSPPRYVGLRNYAALWQDPLFHQSARVTLYYVLGTCVPLWGLALLLALVLNRSWPARGALRLAYFLPAVVPHVVHAIIWRFLFHPYGLLNRGLETLGLPAIAWLADSRAIVPGFILANLWRFAPYFMVVYLAGLESIPAEYYEAASIDGASPGQQFRHITLPLLRPTNPAGGGRLHHPHVEDLHQRSHRLERRARRREPRALALHLSDRLPVSQDGARVRRVGLSLARHHGLHPGPAPPAPERGPWLARGDRGPGSARGWSSCCSPAARSSS